jgi:membrane-associated phospholipid phosphatase
MKLKFRWTFLVLAFLVLLAVFSFADLSIEKALYHPNGFCAFLAKVGQGPGLFLFLVSIVLFILSFPLEKSRKIKSDVLDIQAMRKAALTGICFMVVALGIVFVAKVPWGRPRYWYLIKHPALQFVPWYLPQGKGTGDAFRSFPSGHAVNAALVIWLTLLPSFLPKLRSIKWRVLLNVVAWAWLLLICVSRIMMGAHFASDVLVGAGIGLACFAITKRVFNSEPHERRELDI